MKVSISMGIILVIPVYSLLLRLVIDMGLSKAGISTFEEYDSFDNSGQVATDKTTRNVKKIDRL